MMHWYNIHLDQEDNIEMRKQSVLTLLEPKVQSHPTAVGLAIFTRKNESDGSLDIFVSPELSIASLKNVKASGGRACEEPSPKDLDMLCGSQASWDYLHIPSQSH